MCAPFGQFNAGEVYNGPITPDEPVTIDWQHFVETNIPAIVAALDRLAARPVCMRKQEAMDITASIFARFEGISARQRSWLAWLSLLLAWLLTIGGMVYEAIFTNPRMEELLFNLVFPVFVTVGTLILVRRPENRIGRLCLVIGWIFMFTDAVGLLKQTIPGNAVLPALIRVSLSLGQVMVIFLFIQLPLVFPNGQYLTSRWQRFGKWFSLLMLVPISLAFIQPGPIIDWTADPENVVTAPNPLALNWPWLETISAETLFFAWSIPTMLAVFVSIGSLFLRWRRSVGEIRQQIKWVVFFLCTIVASFILYELVGQLFYSALFESAVYEVMALAAFLGFPLVIGLAVLKYRLYDIDIIINRTLVYGGFSLGVVAIYVLVVGALGTLFQSQGSYLFALLATGFIAVLFQPVRERLQRGVNRLMFGERDDPYAVLSKLGAQLQTTATPEEMLQSVVDTIATTLKLPYVAIELSTTGTVAREGRLGGAATGKMIGETVELPLRYQNETVGYLVVSPRSPGESFTDWERRLLADMAAQTGAVAYSVRLTAALQRSAGALQGSREKLVLAREEERRRIRRDLHDGLGPTLASQTFTLDAILDTLETDPQEAARLLSGLKSQNQETVAEIRRLVYELRPPALDELGLLGALQAHVAQLNTPQALKITITAQPDPLPPLSAGVEVAAYRIALEAITNVVRHAEARACQVCLAVAGNGRSHLRIEVNDDGKGLPPGNQPGVGLNSMRERAEELGGSYRIAAGEGGGTSLTAVLPISVAVSGTGEEP